MSHDVNGQWYPMALSAAWVLRIVVAVLLVKAFDKIFKTFHTRGGD